MNWKLLGSALIFSTLIACGTDGAKTQDDRVHVRGSVAQELRAPGMRAVAIAGDGRWFSTTLDARGAFDLAMPPGASYRVVIVEGQTIVARVVLDGAQGKTVWLKGREAGTISFGVLRQAAGVAPQTVGESESESGDDAAGESAESESENETESADEHGDEGSYDACSGADEKELEPTNPSASEKCEYGEDADEKEHSCGS